MELWKHAFPTPLQIRDVAAEAEAAGWHGLAVVDSQNLTGDAYVALALAATVTERIELGIAVGNSVTRVAAVNACAVLSVDQASGGRMVFGIGRGDSCLVHLGRAPGRLKHFERHLKQLQAYLSGGEVPFDEIDIPLEVAPPADALELAEGPGTSRIAWGTLSSDDAAIGPRKVPVEVAATGPRVIGISAVHADRVMFAVGADPERLAWGIEVAKAARRDAGLDPDGVKFGAYVNMGCARDLDAARDLIRGPMSVFARFQLMQGGTPIGPTSDETAETLRKLHEAYDMGTHSRNQSPQAATLTDKFMDRFGVVGTPDRCIEKLEELRSLGIDKVLLAAQFNENTYDTPEGVAARQLVESEVLPVVQAA